VRAMTRTVGLGAILFPLIYLVSDVVEVVQGDFSTFRLSLTYGGEAGLALVVVGLCVLLAGRLPWWALAGGVAYAYAFVFFTSTVVWALVAGTPDWETLSDDFGWWLTVHGAVMVIGGLALGVGVARSDGYLPRWTGVALGAGVVVVAAASGSGNSVRTIAAAVPDLAFIAMGWTLLRHARR
jgi:hypothetical protein